MSNQNPFSLKKDVIVRKVGRGGLSSKRLQVLWEKGIVGEEELMIMSVLYKLTLLTGKQIENGFLMPGVPPSLTRIRTSNGKNPYNVTIRRLLEIGALEYHVFTAGKAGVIGSRIFSVSNGVRIWLKENDMIARGVFDKGDWKLPVAEEGMLWTNFEYETALKLLSLNSFYISSGIYARGISAYCRASASDEEPVNVYNAGNSECVVVFSHRSDLTSRFRNSYECVRKFGSGIDIGGFNIRYICVVSDIDSAVRCNMSLPEEDRVPLYFITDHDAYGQNPFGYLMKFKDDGRQYIRHQLENYCKKCFM